MRRSGHGGNTAIPSVPQAQHEQAEPGTCSVPVPATGLFMERANPVLDTGHHLRAHGPGARRIWWRVWTGRATVCLCIAMEPNSELPPCRRRWRAGERRRLSTRTRAANLVAPSSPPR